MFSNWKVDTGLFPLLTLVEISVINFTWHPILWQELSVTSLCWKDHSVCSP